MKIDMKKDTVDLEDLKSSWIEKAIDACAGEIPVLSRIPQKTERSNFSFVGIQRYHRMAEIIRNNASERFKTNSDVFRASQGIGMPILYKLFIQNKKKAQAKYSDFYNSLREDDEIIQRMIAIDDFTSSIKRSIEAFQSGIITKQEMEKRLKKTLGSLPAELKEAGERRLAEIKHGKNITYLTSQWGKQKSKM
jgi:hypothetical protein